MCKKYKKVAYTFDEIGFYTLTEMTKEGNFGSLGATIRDSLNICRALLLLNKEGYTEIIVRNPKNGKERSITIHSFNY